MSASGPSAHDSPNPFEVEEPNPFEAGFAAAAAAEEAAGGAAEAGVSAALSSSASSSSSSITGTSKGFCSYNDGLPVLSVPTDEHGSKVMESTRLIRYLLLCDNPMSMDFWARTALSHIYMANPSMSASFVQYWRCVIGLPADIEPKLFVVLAAINSTQSMFQLVKKQSAAEDPQLITALCDVVLQSEFQNLLNFLSVEDKSSQTPADVKYKNGITAFTMNMRTTLLRFS